MPSVCVGRESGAGTAVARRRPRWQVRAPDVRIASEMPPVFRFAPSPNGRLHLGHAYSALLNARLAAAMSGCLLVRIEDIDLARCRPAFERSIFDDLAWLGLSWERPVRRQSEHLPDYLAAFERLRARGLVYPCACTRGDIRREVRRLETEAGQAWPRDPDGVPLYPGTCRGRARTGAVPEAASAEGPWPGAPHVWRLDMEAALAALGEAPGWNRFAHDGASTVAARPEAWGDAVILRREVPASYHLAVVVDDAIQGVTHVVRGLDLERATDLHVVLQRLLGLPSPVYHHHRLLRDGSGAKLSKSAGSPGLAELRCAGRSAESVRRELRAALT